MSLRIAFPCLFVLVLPVMIGCEREIPYGSVEGVVTLDGKPLTDAEVVFMPDPAKGAKGRRSVALTDKNGRYRITSDAGKDGAPVGFHRVIINDMLLGAPGSLRPAEHPEGEQKGPLGTTAPPEDPAAGSNKKKSRFPVAYSNANDTPFRDIEVKPGEQTIDLPLKH